MGALARDLRTAGYRVRNVSYPTRPYDIATLVQRYVEPAITGCGDQAPVHVVTHSLGGILIRLYLQRASLPPASRIVMLAPPNHGSEVADYLRGWWLYRWLFGRVGQQLGTGADSIVRELAPLSCEVGVIAADRSIQPWFAHLMPGENDGVVSVVSARLEEMCDFLVVHNSHTLLMFDRHVRGQVKHFLANGCFDRA